MPATAARTQREEPSFESSGLGDVATRPPVRCVALDTGGYDLSALQLIAENSRLELELTISPTASAVRGHLAGRTADILILGPDHTDESVCLTDDARVAGVPVLVVGAEMSIEAALSAFRAGASDCVPSADLTTEALDQAVESVLKKHAGPQADQLAQISNLQAENETLRRIAIRNMRLLKGQTLPLMSLAWRLLNGEAISKDDHARYAKGLGRITRNVSGMIDDTVIVAATHRAQDVDVDVDLGALVDDIVREDLGEISNSRAHITTGSLPVLRARHGQMRMLFEELLLTAVRNGRIGRVPEIELGSGVDPAGDPVIWMIEKGLQLSARKQALSQRGENTELLAGGTLQDVHSWSLCQRLVERNNGQFKISEPEKNASRIMMRFPKRMLSNLGTVS